MIDEVRCVAPTGDICGEAATWSADENCVYWVDINRFLVHRIDVTSDAVTSHLFDEPVVALSLTTRDDTLLVALGSKLNLLDVETDQRQDLGVTLPGSPAVRFNDGRTDPNGVFWIGSMGNNVGSQGENSTSLTGWANSTATLQVVRWKRLKLASALPIRSAGRQTNPPSTSATH